LWVVGCRMMMQVAGGELGAGGWELGVGRCGLPSRNPALTWLTYEWACETPTGNPAQTKSFVLQDLRVLRILHVLRHSSTVAGGRGPGAGCRMAGAGCRVSGAVCRAASVAAVRAATNCPIVPLSCCPGVVSCCHVVSSWGSASMMVCTGGRYGSLVLPSETHPQGADQCLNTPMDKCFVMMQRVREAVMCVGERASPKWSNAGGMSRITCHMSYAAYRMSNVAYHISRIACRAWHDWARAWISWEDGEASKCETPRKMG
jgi:hypothetical protein